MKSLAQEKQDAASELQGTERERVIRKIKRCLALGESSNPNEAQMAMRQAQKMMEQYQLGLADVDAESVGMEQRDTGLQRMPDWLRALGLTAAQAFDCNFLMLGRFQQSTTFMFVGVMPAAELAAYAFDSLLVQVKAARKQYQASQKKSSRRKADDFCQAWVWAVSEKVERYAKANATEDSQTANALVVVKQRNQAEIDVWLESLGEIGEHKHKSRELDKHALIFGISAGLKANLHSAVHGKQEGQPMLSHQSHRDL